MINDDSDLRIQNNCYEHNLLKEDENNYFNENNYSTNDITDNNNYPIIHPNNYLNEIIDDNLTLTPIEENNSYNILNEKTQNNNLEIDEKNFIIPNHMNNYFDLEENNFKEQINKNDTEYLKKKQGRKRKSEDRTNVLHSNSAKDNVIYKLKVQTMKCIYDIILKKINKISPKKVKLNKIVGTILKEGKRNINLKFFQKTIKEILLMEKSKRHKNNKIPDNEITINQYESEIKDILNIKFVDFVEKIFMQFSPEQLNKTFGVTSYYLFQTIELTKEQQTTMKSLADFGILKYYENIRPRMRNKKNLNRKSM
jgi:hypothetical protein